MKTNDELDESIRKLGIMVEHMVGQNQTILEAVSDMQQHTSKIPQMQEDNHELKQDMKIVKAAVTDTSREVHEIDQRVSQVEARA